MDVSSHTPSVRVSPSSSAMKGSSDKKSEKPTMNSSRNDNRNSNRNRNNNNDSHSISSKKKEKRFALDRVPWYRREVTHALRDRAYLEDDQRTILCGYVVVVIIWVFVLCSLCTLSLGNIFSLSPVFCSLPPSSTGILHGSSAIHTSLSSSSSSSSSSSPPSSTATLSTPSTPSSTAAATPASSTPTLSVFLVAPSQWVHHDNSDSQLLEDSMMRLFCNVLVAVEDDDYYCYLIPATIPATIIFIYFNWMSLKFFRHN